MPGFALNYGDYLRNAPGLNASENATVPMTQEEWNLLAPQQQWGLLGNGNQGIAVNQFDSRYGDLKPTVGGEANRSVMVMPGVMGSNFDNRGIQRFNDPGKVVQGDGYYSSSEDNTTAAAQKEDQWSFARNVAKIYAALAGGAWAAESGLLGGGVEGAAAPALDESAGLAMGNPFTGAATEGAATGGAASGATPGMMSANGYSGAGMIAPGMEGSAAADSALINAGLPRLAGGAATGLLGDGTMSGAAGHLGNWALTHPIQAVGAVQTVGGLFNHGGQGVGGSPNNSSGSKSSPGTGISMQRPEFQQNPYLRQQLVMRGYQ